MDGKMADRPAAARAQGREAVVFFDTNNLVTFINTAAERLWGLSQAEAIGRDVSELIPGASEERGGELPLSIVRDDGSLLEGVVSVTRAQHKRETYYIAFVRPALSPVAPQMSLGILAAVAEKTDRGVLVADAHGKVIYANSAFHDMLDAGIEGPTGLTLAELFCGRLGNGGFAEHIKDAMERRISLAEDVSLKGKSGMEVWVSANVTPVMDRQTGELEQVVAVIADITHTRLVEDLQRQVLGALAADAPIADIMDILCRKVQGLAPDALCSILGVTADERLTVLAAPSLPAEFSAAVEGVAIGPKSGSCGTAAFRGVPVLVEDIATSPLWEDFQDLPIPPGITGCWSIPVKLRGGKVAATFAFYFQTAHGPTPWLENVVAACSDLCALALERFEAKKRIEMLANVDTLTGLANRRQLHAVLEELLVEARTLEQPLAVLYLDIDHFKDVNETLGHSTGDQLLVEVSRRLKAQLRTGDVVGRTGGDEFLVLVHDCTAEEAARIARRLLEYVAAPITAQALHLTMSASVGIALYPDHGTDAETLLKHADTAVHEAKRKGRGKFHFFTEELNRRVLDRLVLSVALREAIQNRALRLVYQPQVLLASGALHGVEALSRWTDPIHGDVPATRFIPLAEEYGLIESIDEWAVETACQRIAAWRAEGVDVPHVSVNLSPLSFRGGDIVGFISGALREYDLKPSDLRVEITERVMMDQHPNSFATARAIEALGVRIAMDDFGTGYSSLSALSRLPIAELKIDRSFMLSIEQDQNAQALATAVIRIGHSLGMTVVAEGVETQAQADLLRFLGCHAAQGFLFARPIEAADVGTWLAAQRAR
ncbi:EAL domain-containing protein [Xanthobacter aminoxidans]|uniref:EAL domain-containing protein n=1 Tax=Xanthobacter aminoxidans TaxID=186280 RepID=UPI0037289B54